MGLQWFMRVLLQWVVIAVFACLPLLFPGGWPILHIFCGIVLFGLLSYGLLNPALLVRRALAWGAMACISASLAAGVFPPLEVSALTEIGVPEKLASLAAFVLTHLSQPIMVWPAIAVLTILAIHDLAPQLIDRVLESIRRSDVILARAEHAGRLVRANPKLPFEAQHTLSVTNRLVSELQLVGASMTVMGFIQRPAMLFSGDPLVEASAQSPLSIPPGGTAHVEVVCNRFPRIVNWIFAMLKVTRLAILLDIGASIRVYGGAELENQRQTIVLLVR